MATEVGGMHPTGIHYFYRQQWSCGKVMLFTPVCHSVHRGRVSVSDRPPWTETPKQRTPNRDPPRQRPPGQRIPGQRPLWTETPLDRDPSGQRPPQTETPWTENPGQRPVWTETPRRTLTSGRYASYWNAFFFLNKIKKDVFTYNIWHDSISRGIYRNSPTCSLTVFIASHNLSAFCLEF